jgi:signal peptidase I
MASRTRFGFILPLLFSMNTWAADISIKPNHPDQYTVVKNDTLWDISGKFLQHPWQWPELWNQNKQIKDPNLIYPGDTIYFSMVNGKPQLSINRNPQQALLATNCILKEEDYKNGRKDFALDKSGKLKPCIRESEIEKPIKLIPFHQIAKYLSSPKVLAENELNQSPYVVDVANDHVIGGPGDKIYIRAINEPTSTEYMVYRNGDTFIDAETKEVLGYEAIYIANASLQQAGDPATLMITKSNSEIRMGDRVMPYTDDEISLNYFARPPEKPIKGSIISVLNGVSQIGISNVVVIDKGKRDGLLPGHELDIYQNGGVTRDPYSAVKSDAVRLPDELAGMLMVFRTFDRVSYALVMEASGPLHLLDRVQTP